MESWKIVTIESCSLFRGVPYPEVPLYMSNLIEIWLVVTELVTTLKLKL